MADCSGITDQHGLDELLDDGEDAGGAEGVRDDVEEILQLVGHSHDGGLNLETDLIESHFSEEMSKTNKVGGKPIIKSHNEVIEHIDNYEEALT